MVLKTKMAYIKRKTARFWNVWKKFGRMTRAQFEINRRSREGQWRPRIAKRLVILQENVDKPVNSKVSINKRRDIWLNDVTDVQEMFVSREVLEQPALINLGKTGWFPFLVTCVKSQPNVTDGWHYFNSLVGCLWARCFNTGGVVNLIGTKVVQIYDFLPNSPESLVSTNTIYQ